MEECQVIDKQIPNYEKSNDNGLDAGSWHGPQRKRANDEFNDGFGYDRYNDKFWHYWYDWYHE